MLPIALALALAAGSAAADETAADPFPTEETPRLDLTLWGGAAWPGMGGHAEGYGGEATWRFDRLDLGLFGGAYRLRDESLTGSTEPRTAPVWLVRLGQRFETRNGLLASFTLGAGALKPSTWRSWFQVALGARIPLGPAFVAGELSFESESFIRLSLGLGASFL